MEDFDDTLSISPRKSVPYIDDTENVKDIEKVLRKQLCEKLIALIYAEVLKNKPSNIPDFIVKKLLVPGGPIEKLKESA